MILVLRIRVKVKNLGYGRGICKTWDRMKEKICWALGDRRRVRFWLDSWLDIPGSLLKYAIGVIPENFLQMGVSEFVNGNGHWAWYRFQEYPPTVSFTHIATTKPPLAFDGDDRIFWILSESGKFTIASTYNLVAGWEWPNAFDKWKVV